MDATTTKTTLGEFGAAQERRAWHMIATAAASGREYSEWFLGRPSVAERVASRNAGPLGRVIRCEIAEIPSHAARTGWAADDLPRSYEG